MSSILESLASSINPDTAGALGKALSVDSAMINRGLGAAGPLLLSGMSKMAGAPGGAESLLKMLLQDGGGALAGLGNLGGMLSGLVGGQSGGGMLASLLGPGTNAIGAALSKAIGFNVTPLLGMVAPAIMGVVAKTAKAQNLDAGGLSALLQKETGAFTADPANKETVAMLASAQAAGDAAEAMIKKFGPEWSQVVMGPAAAMFMVAQSDLSGPLGMIEEAKAASVALTEAASHASPTSVLASAFGGGLTTTSLEQIRSAKPTPDKLLEMVKASAHAVAAKAPGEAQAYKDTVMKVARATAEAAKEGGFLGIGGTLVSAKEQEALQRLETALA